MTSETPRFVEGAQALVEAYDLFLLDQYGVLHDGLAAYPGAVEALRELRARGRRLCVITNSGRSAEHNAARIVALGVEEGLLDAVVTSGDAALAWLLAEAPATRCFVICLNQALNPLVGTGVPMVERIEEAELIYFGGMPGEPGELTLEDFEPWLAAGLRRNLPMVCANPDRVGPLGDRVVLSPGGVAEAYAQRGGKVLSFGKPEPAIFRQALALYPEIPPSRVLMIGDMPDTDLAGAAAAGLDSAWVTGGVFRARIEEDPRGPEAASLEFLAAAGAKPAWVLPALVW